MATSHLVASDHADAPVSGIVVRQDANLTDLHAFTVDGANGGRDLVLALSTNPTIPPSATDYLFPSDVTFEIHIDSNAAVSPDDPSGIMGGTILDPQRIQSDRVVSIRFNKKGEPQIKLLGHGKAPRDWSWFAGLRDDPFIRGPRRGRNVASIVVQLPLEYVTPTQSTLLIWASSRVDGFPHRFQDLAGRSLRSMMPENQPMNLMDPKHQAKAMDTAPDVMIFDTSLPAAFPNGRALTDDVIDLIGDPRVLANDAPFPSENDLPFLDTFPYLAEPHLPTAP